MSIEEEIERAAGLIAAAAPGEALISYDTSEPKVAAAAIEAARALHVNDVSGLRDPRLAEVCAANVRGPGRVLMAHGGGA